MFDSSSNRRDFLTGRAVRDVVESSGSKLAEQMQGRPVPSRGPTLMLRTPAMACDFDIVMNPNPSSDQMDVASAALDLVHPLEQQLSVYRADSELSELNRRAFRQPVRVNEELFDLLWRGKELSDLTAGAFDPAAGALVNLWRLCRQNDRIPTTEEIVRTLPCCGVSQIQFDGAEKTIAFGCNGVEFNLGAIGKGYAVDRIAEEFLSNGLDNGLVHGGRSSIRAHGMHAEHDGWPIGLRNPLMPDKPYATLLLKDAALGTSGTAVQWFRHAGRRYGHILDPRSGWPVETLLSVSVIAPDAAMADALSTAFFVLGVEKSIKCCDNLPASVGAIFFPLPSQGQTLQPILHNVSSERWFTN